MPDKAANIAAVLAKRQLPTITTWNRVEGRPRQADFARALKAEVRDPLFFLARQWQMGEFRADDAGSPALVRAQMATSRLRTYQAAGGPPAPFDDFVPIEARVEARPLPFAIDGKPVSLDVRLLLGRQFLKMAAAVADYGAAFIERYPIREPDPTAAADAWVAAHAEAFQTWSALAGRCMDGGALFSYLTGAAGRHAWDGIPGVLAIHQQPLDDVATAWMAWFRKLLAQPASTEDAWLPDRLEYQFACGVPQGSREKVLTAEEYYQGHLDWYNLDSAQSRELQKSKRFVDPQATPVQTMIPVPITYDGMPNTRWWAFEESRVNFGGVKPATTDLGKLMLLEFGLVYANDWFLIPQTIDAGSIAQVRALALTNVFGERFWIGAAGSNAADAWQKWSMFTLSPSSGKGTNDASLLLLPTAPKVQEGPDLEAVALVRDEVANMVWGVEKIIPLATGAGKPGREAALETAAYFRRLLDARLQTNPPPPAQPAAPVVYKVMNSVPEHWIPFISVHVPNDVRAMQLQRAAMPRLMDGDADPPQKILPRTTLLREGLDSTPRAPYFLHEEEVPRAGALVSLSYQRTRWTDGRVVVWLGGRKQAGRGEGSSGLVFDRLVNAPPVSGG